MNLASVVSRSTEATIQRTLSYRISVDRYDRSNDTCEMYARLLYNLSRDTAVSNGGTALSYDYRCNSTYNSSWNKLLHLCNLRTRCLESSQLSSISPWTSLRRLWNEEASSFHSTTEYSTSEYIHRWLVTRNTVIINSSKRRSTLPDSTIRKYRRNWVPEFRYWNDSSRLSSTFTYRSFYFQSWTLPAILFHWTIV